MNLEISDTRDYFTYADRPFFYLADTVWHAFAWISFDEWEEYLDYRKMQGFNALQIRLSQDQSIFGSKPYPFHLDASGKLDFYQINDEFFERAAKLLMIATQKGFIPVLVVLWADKVKDTWLSDLDPSQIMPLDAVEQFAGYVGKVFAEFNPIYFVSGDTNFASEQTHEAYMVALNTLKSISPDALAAMHIWGDSTYLPDDVVQSKDLDFYIYQSGHKRAWQHFPYQFAQDLYRQPIKRPILNSEPCYEGLPGLLGWGQFEDYRFNAFDVRKAVWQSLLSGGKAGVAYGANGTWRWYRQGEATRMENLFGKSYDWRTALRFEGGWDVAFAKWIFETYNLFDLEPKDIIESETAEVRASVSSDKVVIYIPFNHEVKVNIDLTDHNWTLVDLAEKRFAQPEIVNKQQGSVIKMSPFNSDVLLIGKK